MLAPSRLRCCSHLWTLPRSRPSSSCSLRILSHIILILVYMMSHDVKTLLPHIIIHATCVRLPHGSIQQRVLAKLGWLVLLASLYLSHSLSLPLYNNMDMWYHVQEHGGTSLVTSTLAHVATRLNSPSKSSTCQQGKHGLSHRVLQLSNESMW